MATRTITNRNFSSSLKSKVSKAKAYGKQYADDFSKAYSLGFSHGWDNAYSYPNRTGLRSVAGIGYRNGIKSRYKRDMLQSNYKKYSGRKK